MSETCNEKKHIFINYPDITNEIIDEVINEITKIYEELGRESITSTYYNYEVEYFILDKIRNRFEIVNHNKDSITSLRDFIRAAVDTKLQPLLNIH